jgi:hypothetical protein
VEFLRWILFLPSAGAGGILGIFATILVLFFISLANKFAGIQFNPDNPLGLIAMGYSFTYCWFATGMYVAPKKQDPKAVLFALTTLLLFLTGVGWAPLFYRFNQTDFLSGKFIGFIWGLLGIIGTTAWIWFGNKPKKDLLALHSGNWRKEKP